MAAFVGEIISQFSIYFQDIPAILISFILHPIMRPKLFFGFLGFPFTKSNLTNTKMNWKNSFIIYTNFNWVPFFFFSFSLVHSPSIFIWNFYPNVAGSSGALICINNKFNSDLVCPSVFTLHIDRSFSQRRIASSPAYFVPHLPIATERLFHACFWIVLYFPLTS